MATIDLGKIKQVWRGTYNNGTAYVVDDLVAYTDSGILSTYICVANSTGNAPSSSGTAHASWNYVSKGGAAGANGSNGSDGADGTQLPSQSGHAGKFLKTDGTNYSYAEAGGGKVLQVQHMQLQGSVSISSGSRQTITGLNHYITPQTGSKILFSMTIHYRLPAMGSFGTNGEGFGIGVHRTPAGGSSTQVYQSRSGSGHDIMYYVNNVTSANYDRADFQFLDTNPGGDGSTALTYSVKANCHHARQVVFNDFASSITLTEIGA